MKSVVTWQINLRDQGPDGPILHTICRFSDGHYELDGVVILAEHIKRKLGGDGVTKELWAEKVAIR